MPTMKNVLSDPEILSVFHISLCFTVLFSADFTLTYMQKSVTSSIADDDPQFSVDGYVTLATVYCVYGLALWLAPSALSAAGLRFCLVFGSFCYVLHPLSFLTEKVWVTLGALVAAGVGGSLLWVAHGSYMIQVSSEATLPRNIGLFWTLYSASMIPGNVYAVLELEGKERIDRPTRQTLLLTLSGLAVGATFLFVFLRPATGRAGEGRGPGALGALGSTWAVFRSRSFLALLPAFVYTGFQQAFGSGVLGPTIGFTRQLGAKQSVPLSGLCYGSGELIGGLWQLVSSRALRKSKLLAGGTVLLGLTVQLTALVLAGLCLPDSAVFGETQESGILPHQSGLPGALASALMMGFGDSVLNTQIYPLLAVLQPESSPQTCALYKFTKSMAMAAYFLASTRVGLHAQLIALGCSGVAGAACFVVVERWSRVNTGLYVYN